MTKAIPVRARICLAAVVLWVTLGNAMSALPEFTITYSESRNVIDVDNRVFQDAIGFGDLNEIGRTLSPAAAAKRASLSSALHKRASVNCQRFWCPASVSRSRARRCQPPQLSR